MARGAAPAAECVTVAATDPLYILYTSGTTGKPKGVVRDNGGYAVALRWSMAQRLRRRRRARRCSPRATSAGSSATPTSSTRRCSPGATTVLYEGKPVGTPDAGAFWRVVAEHGVAACSPRPPRSGRSRRRTRTASTLADYDLSSLRDLFLAGERLDPETYQWAARAARRPGDRPLVADRDRLADRRQPARASSRCRSSPARRRCRCPATTCGSSTAPGEPVAAGRRRRDRHQAADAAGHAADAVGRRRALRRLATCRPIDGYYLTGDGGYVDEDGYLFVMGRTDDVINVAGHRLSTGSLEEVLAAHPAVAECAVIGVADELKGQVPRGFVVLKAGVDVDADVSGRPSWSQLVRGGGRRGRGAARRSTSCRPAQDPLGQDPAQDDARASPTADARPCRRRSRTRPCSTPSPGAPFPTRLTGAGAERASQAAARGHRNRAVARLRWGVGRPAARVRVRGGG